MRLILLGLLLTANTGGSGPVRATDEDVQIVQCGPFSGSAFRVSGNRYVTAEHVTVGGPCTINGVPLVRLDLDAGKDFVTLSATGSGDEFGIDCAGYVPGAPYRAIGYVDGQMLILPLTATGEKVPSGAWAGMHVLYNAIIPGMSGGPIINRAGSVVGINNALSIGPGVALTFSRPLSETSLCQPQ